MLDPGQVTAKVRRHHLCRVDRKTCVVMRNGKAVPLGLVSFAVFLALHEASRDGFERRPKRLTRMQIYEAVYGNVVNPPQPCVLTQIIWQMNQRLEHVDLVLRCYGSGRRAAWVLEAKAACAGFVCKTCKSRWSHR